MKSNHKLGLMMATMIMGAVKHNDKSFIDIDMEFDPKQPETNQERAKRFGLKEWHLNGKTVYAATKKKALILSKNN